jgi:F-type H+-transporting ATPase subunit epsilon
MVMRQDASTGEMIETKDDKPAASSGGKPSMNVKVYAPFKVYFEGPAYSISAASATGPFDILPHHHNFITLLLAGDVVIRPMSGSEQKVRISGGVMHVKQDDVVVFLDV